MEEASLGRKFEYRVYKGKMKNREPKNINDHDLEPV